MPERGGLWLWEQALKARRTLRGRFVLISSDPVPEPRTMSLFIQSEHFILKPLSLAAVWGQVEEILRRSGVATEAERGDLTAESA